MKEWQELKIDFFVEEILERYWKGENGTKNKILEFQFFPAIITKESDRRVFLGHSIKPWLDIASPRSKEIRNQILESSGITGLREFEKNYAVGLLITDPETDHKCVDIAPFSRKNQTSYNLFLSSTLGYDIPDVDSFPVVLWFNPGIKDNGEVFYDFKDVTPKPDRMVRVRVWEENEFWELIDKYLKKNKFPKSIKKEDPCNIIEL